MPPNLSIIYPPSLTELDRLRYYVERELLRVAWSAYFTIREFTPDEMIEPILLRGPEIMTRGAIPSSLSVAMRVYPECEPQTPNQALEPTTLLVTIPAAREVAPSRVVAHL